MKQMNKDTEEYWDGALDEMDGVGTNAIEEHLDELERLEDRSDPLHPDYGDTVPLDESELEEGVPFFDQDDDLEWEDRI